MNYTRVTDLNDPALAVYSKLNEVQLKRYYEPEEGLSICESPKVIRRALDAGYEPVSLLLEPKYLEGEDADIAERISSDPEVPIYSAPLEVLSKLTGYFLTGGMLCAMRRKPLASVEELIGRLMETTSAAITEGSISAQSQNDSELLRNPAPKSQNSAASSAIRRSVSAAPLSRARQAHTASL